ncbi:MAG: hypothetical protein R2813_04505 [Flavobacteriales bacterium]
MEKVQSEIATILTDYDSVLLFNVSSYYKPSNLLCGTIIKDHGIEYLTIEMVEDTFSFYDMKVMSVKTSYCESCAVPNLSEIESIRDDSLNYQGFDSNGLKTETSDREIWSILIWKNRELLLKQSYNPVELQSLYPTRDRQIFVDLINSYRSLLSGK